MDGDVDVAADLRDIEFLGEQAFAARFRQRPILNGVACRLDDDDLDPVLRHRVSAGKQRADLMRLRKRQRRSARANSRQGSVGHARLEVALVQRFYRVPGRGPIACRRRQALIPPPDEVMRVLGIETTCDETAAAVVRLKPEGGGEILANQVRSQIDERRPFGGVVPEIAARAHVEIIDEMIRRALEDAHLDIKDIDGVAAAAGPGLIGGVMVGLVTGKALALATGKPFVAVNHLEAHALTARLTDNLTFPYLLLLVSGGHTQLVAINGVGDYTRLGTTVDDAVGEAFDKVAKLLGLPYPGGPNLELEAAAGNPSRYDLPRPMLARQKPDFSLSGLKTAVRLQAERSAPMQPEDVSDLCASFQAAIVDVLVDRTRMGLRAFRAQFGHPTALVVAGGVAANQTIRRALVRFCGESGLRLVAPPLHLCTDNGAMIAWTGIERLRLGLTDPLDFPARPRWPLDQKAARVHNGKA